MARDSIGIGKVLGINVEAHWTLIFLLLISLLIPIIFLFLILVFVSVFFHELSHSVTAIKSGRRVSRILLTPLGGASVLDDINIDPRTEFRISIVGPIANFVMAGFSAIVLVFTPLGAITTAVQLFFLINVLLGVSNILPIFPLDGSRIFRSYLQQTRSKFDATMVTVKLSKALLGITLVSALVFVALPLGYTPTYRLIVLVWSVFIVVLLWGGTRAEQDAAVIRKEAEGLNVKGAIRKRFIYAAPEKRLSSLYASIIDANEHIVITKLGNTFCMAEINRTRMRKDVALVKDLAVPVPTFAESVNAVDALASMEARDSSVAVIVKAGKPVGILTVSHLQAFISLHLLAKKERATSHLRG